MEYFQILRLREGEEGMGGVFSGFAVAGGGGGGRGGLGRGLEFGGRGGVKGRVVYRIMGLEEVSNSERQARRVGVCW